ncbi:hypothetical protein I4U23_012033 [Adineta vaga]|nr:hypothetical protein I4U23_012033 [Adineta vaga]
MFRLTCLGLFVTLSIIKGTSADWCYTGTFSSYYCYPGQSCGSYYGDCRGLPTYAIIGIVSSCIVLLSICIRCCIHMNASNNRAVPRRVPMSPQNVSTKSLSSSFISK